MLFLGVVISKLFVFLRQIVIIRLLSPADYGLFSLGFTFLILYTIIGSLGLNYGSQREIAFYYEKGDILAVRGVVKATSCILAVSSTIVAILAIILAWPLPGVFDEPQLRTVLLLLAPTIPLSIGIAGVTSFYLGFKRVGTRAYLDYIGLTGVSLILILVLTLVFRSLVAALAGLLIAYAVIFVVALLYSIFRFPVSILRKESKRGMSRELLSFSVPLFAVFSLNFLVAHTDILMLGYYSTAENVGFYNAAFAISAFVGIFLNTFSHIYLSVASGFIALDAKKEIQTLYSTTTKWIYVFTFPLFLLFFLFPGSILGLTYGVSYETAATVLKLLCLGEFIFIITGPNVATLTAYGKSRSLMLYFLLGAIANILLNMLLIPGHGINGAAIASAISLMIVNILCSLHLFIGYRIHPFSKSFIQVILLLLVLSGAFYFAFHYLEKAAILFLVGFYPLFLAVSVLIIQKSLDQVDRMIIMAVRGRIKVAVESLLGRTGMARSTNDGG